MINHFCTPRTLTVQVEKEIIYQNLNGLKLLTAAADIRQKFAENPIVLLQILIKLL
jgi:hypothetical protein